MPLMKMNLYTQNTLINSQAQYFQNQIGFQPVIRLGSLNNRTLIPLFIQGNKSCTSCSGK